MDTSTLIKSMKEAVGGGILKPNEARKRLNYAPAAGGDQVFLQEQNYSLSALAKRDAQEDPFGTAAPAAQPVSNEDDEPDEDVEEQASLGAWLFKTHMDRLAA